jgi:hypothetical protein
MRKLKEKRYIIRTILCSVISSATILVMISGVTIIIVYMLYYKLQEWIDKVITSTVLVNIKIGCEGEALNV